MASRAASASTSGATVPFSPRAAYMPSSAASMSRDAGTSRTYSARTRANAPTKCWRRSSAEREKASPAIAKTRRSIDQSSAVQPLNDGEKASPMASTLKRATRRDTSHIRLRRPRDLELSIAPDPLDEARQDLVRFMILDLAGARVFMAAAAVFEHQSADVRLGRAIEDGLADREDRVHALAACEDVNRDVDFRKQRIDSGIGWSRRLHSRRDNRARRRSREPPCNA